MTDSGRELYKSVRAENRILRPSAGGKDLPLKDAISQVVDSLSGKRIAVVASCHSTVEEQVLTKRLIDSTNARTFLRGHFGEDDGILLSADRSPNLCGALVTGLIDQYPEDNLNSLNEALSRGEFDAVFVMNEDLVASGINEENLQMLRWSIWELTPTPHQNMLM